MRFRFLGFALALLAAVSPALAQENFGAPGGAGGGTGTVTSITTGCGVAGGPITGVGAISGAVVTNPQAGASYSFLATDCGKLVTTTNAGAIAGSLVNANFTAGQYINVRNIAGAAGVLTLTPTSGTIDGAASLALQPGQAGITVTFDGTNWTSSGLAASGPASATDGNFALYSGASGQLLKDTSKVAPAGAVVGTTDSQALTNKSIAASEVNSGTLSYAQTPILNHPGYKSSVWYQPLGIINTATGAAPALTTAYCSIGAIGQLGGGNVSATIASLGTRIITLGTTNIQLAIYNDDATVSPHRPGTLIDSTPSMVDTSATSVSANLNATHSVTPGYYWFCIQVGDVTVRYISRAGAQLDMTEFGLVGSATLGPSLASANVTGGVSTTTGIVGFGTWPGNLNGSTWTEVGTTAPDIVFQFSAIP